MNKRVSGSLARLALSAALLLMPPLLASAQAASAHFGARGDGPNAYALGMAQGYPACAQPLTQERCRVGSWSGGQPDIERSDVAPAVSPRPLPRHPSPPEIRWGRDDEHLTIEDYLNKVQVTGLLIIKDGQVLAERYQYDRKPGMPMRSFSMAKTIKALLLGIALDKGLIRSLDDKAADYWPEIAPSAYGQTTLRNLLRMSSGMPFKELYTWTPDDDIWVWGQVLYHRRNAGQPERVTEFLNARTEREAEQGGRFHYASIETEILGRVLIRATGKSITQLTEDWLWKPMGAEHRAFWVLSTTDRAEGVAGGFNASLRDYGRLGMLLADDGQRDGSTILPKEYLLDATDVTRQPAAFRPGKATRFLGYGYQTWLLPYKTRTFALQGIHGQTIYVQPATRTVMVQTAVYSKGGGRQDPEPYRLRHAFWQGVLRSVGGVVD